MIEHRLIEKMLALMQRETVEITKGKSVDVRFVEIIADFMRTYADQTHHGKEEKILFEALRMKLMRSEHAAMMIDLIREHEYTRRVTSELFDLRDSLTMGIGDPAPQLLRIMGEYARYYPLHIAKEDKVFFPVVPEYLSKAEQEAMLSEFLNFDGNMIHQKYRDAIDTISTLAARQELQPQAAA